MNIVAWSDVGGLYLAVFGVLGLLLFAWLPIDGMFKRKISRSGRKRSLHGVAGWGCAGILSAFAWFGVAVIICLAIFVNMGGFR